MWTKAITGLLSGDIAKKQYDDKMRAQQDALNMRNNAFNYEKQRNALLDPLRKQLLQQRIQTNDLNLKNLLNPKPVDTYNQKFNSMGAVIRALNAGGRGLAQQVAGQLGVQMDWKAIEAAQKKAQDDKLAWNKKLIDYQKGRGLPGKDKTTGWFHDLQSRTEKSIGSFFSKNKGDFGKEQAIASSINYIEQMRDSTASMPDSPYKTQALNYFDSFLSKLKATPVGTATGDKNDPTGGVNWTGFANESRRFGVK